MSNIIFREGNANDLPALKQLFFDTISWVCNKDYSDEQIEVWRNSVKNEERWNGIIQQQYVLIAEKDDVLLGFIALENKNYLDFLYVNKDFQGQKIALQLYQRIEERALTLDQGSLSSDVSITARPFFEKMGFRVVKEQIQKREGVSLMNYKMKKELLT